MPTPNCHHSPFLNAEAGYEANGFTKVWIWFDAKALSAVAVNNHQRIVQYLLGQMVDPNLEGCLCEDVYCNVFKTAKMCNQK